MNGVSFHLVKHWVVKLILKVLLFVDVKLFYLKSNLLGKNNHFQNYLPFILNRITNRNNYTLGYDINE